MAIIKKKCWPEWFDKFCSGERTLELRLADFDLKDNDILIMEEYNPEIKQYTGRTASFKCKKVEHSAKDPLQFYNVEKVHANGFWIIQLEKKKYEEQIPSKEKPPFLYHGSPHRDIEEFEPRISKGTGEECGAMVYATPDLATASAFLTEIEKEWSAGRLDDTFYTIIPLSREEFIKNDKGGYIYVLPSVTFESDPKRGLGEYEWASKEKVKPLKKIEYASALDAMLENGVQIYFIDDKTFRQIKESNDHGLSILRNLESENQRRGINIKLLKKQDKPKNALIPE